MKRLSRPRASSPLDYGSWNKQHSSARSLRSLPSSLKEKEKKKEEKKISSKMNKKEISKMENERYQNDNDLAGLIAENSDPLEILLNIEAEQYEGDIEYMEI